MYVFNLPKVGNKSSSWRQELHGKALTTEGLRRLNYLGKMVLQIGDVEGNAGMGYFVTRDMVIFRR